MKILRILSIEEFPDYVKAFRDSDHWLPTMTDEVLAATVEVVDAYIEERETWEDTESAILVRLSDGRYGIFREWSDSTGHG